MANTEGEPVLNPEEEEISLSDSELDNVLKSANITSEPSGGAEQHLEQYGVWVKVEPQNVEEETEENMAFELSDLQSDDESALTEEEEQLLGELEDNAEDDLAGLSGLEEDLEELGKGAVFADDEGEELTVEDLDVDFDDLGDENLAEDAGALEGLPEMEGEEEFGIDIDADTEIEVPLSDSAIVEEHYEDLATVEGVPSTPGQAPRKASSSILEKIEQDLNQIKTEIQSLKSELIGLGKGGLPSGKGEVAPARADSDGFFQKGEEETIALTGDELDNILNTADVTEEIEGPEETEPLAEPDEEIMELGSLDLVEEAPSEELSLEELEPFAAEDESIEIDIGDKSEEEELLLDESESFEDIEELSLDEDLGTLGGETEELEEIEELEELGLEEPEDESELGEEGEAEEISLAEPAMESELDEIDELENLSFEEPDADSSLEEVEEFEELSLEEPGDASELEEAEAAEALILEELPGDEDSLQDDVLALDDLEDTGLEAEDTEDLELAAEELSIPEEPEDLEVEELGGFEEESEEPQLQGSSQVLPQDLQADIKSVLSYLDQLFEALPEEKIKEFAQSEYFGIYKRLFEELGLGA
jgi:pilus assembly protein FimV